MPNHPIAMSDTIQIRTVAAFNVRIMLRFRGVRSKIFDVFDVDCPADFTGLAAAA
jgi:hypothetical protein